MINHSVLAKLEQTDIEQKQRVEQRRRLNNFADKVLHVPKAPTQKIFEDPDPRKRKLKKVECATYEEEKLRQFANTAGDVENDRLMIIQRQELFGNKLVNHNNNNNNNEKLTHENEDSDNINSDKIPEEIFMMNRTTRSLIQRPQSARSAFNPKRCEEIRKQAMTPRMRVQTINNGTKEENKNSITSTTSTSPNHPIDDRNDRRRRTIFETTSSSSPHQQASSILQRKYQSSVRQRPSFGGVGMFSTSISNNNNNNNNNYHDAPSTIKKTDSKLSTTSLALEANGATTTTATHHKKKSVRLLDENNIQLASASRKYSTTSNSSSSSPRKPRNRLFSMIDIVDADEEEEELFGKSDTSNDNSNSGTNAFGADNDCEFQVYERKSSSRRISSASKLSTTSTDMMNMRSTNANNNNIKLAEDEIFQTMSMNTPKTPPEFSSSSNNSTSQHRKLPQRIALGKVTTKENPSTALLSASTASSPSFLTRQNSSSRALLSQQRKSIVSGIFNRTNQQQEKVKVAVQGDIRLKVIENQWHSPSRRFPRNYKSPRVAERDGVNSSNSNGEDQLLFDLQQQKKRSIMTKQQQNDDQDEIRLQCVIEHEKQAAKDRKELAVTFTEKFLKIKDGSCRPLKSRFLATAKREEKFLFNNNNNNNRSTSKGMKATSGSHNNEPSAEHAKSDEAKAQDDNDDDEQKNNNKATTDSFFGDDDIPDYVDDDYGDEEPVAFELDDMKPSNSLSTSTSSPHHHHSSAILPSSASFRINKLKQQQQSDDEANAKENLLYHSMMGTARAMITTESDRLPRSSWHIDFSVEESERRVWKWFTKKLYQQANISTAAGGNNNNNNKDQTNSGDSGGPSSPFLKIKRTVGAFNYHGYYQKDNDNDNDRYDENDERTVYLSSSSLKNVTITGCAKGFDIKRFRIPDPPSLEEQLHNQEEQERKRSGSVSSSCPSAETTGHVVITDDGRGGGAAALTPGSNLSRINSMSSAALRRATSDLPASLLRAESMRHTASFRISPSTTAMQRRNNSMSSGFLNVGGGGGGGGVSPSPQRNQHDSLSRGQSMMMMNNRNSGGTVDIMSSSTTGGGISGSLARFRSRKYFESATKLREQQADQEAKDEKEKLRRAQEEERKMKKALQLDSMTFLQCSMDNSAGFFRKLASEERIVLNAISLEHCKLPRNKNEDDDDDDSSKNTDDSSGCSDGDEEASSGDESSRSKSSSKTTELASKYVNSLRTTPSATAKTTSLTVTPPTLLISNKTGGSGGAIGTMMNNDSFSDSNNKHLSLLMTSNSSSTTTPRSKSIPTIRIVSPLAKSLNNSSFGGSSSTRTLVLTTPRERALQVKRQRAQNGGEDAANDIVSELGTPQAGKKRRDTMPPQQPMSNSNSSRPLKVAFLEERDEGEEERKQKNHQDGRKQKKERKKNKKKKKHGHEGSSSSSSSSDEDDDNGHDNSNNNNDSTDAPWKNPDVEEDFADAFLDHFVLSQASTLTSLSFHGTRFTETFLERLAELIRSKALTKLKHLDIGLCGVESVDSDQSPYCAKLMASAIAHAPHSLTSVSLTGTALSPHYVGVAFCAAIRANFRIRKFDCVGCDRGGTRFEQLIREMLQERDVLYERKKRRTEMKLERTMSKVKAAVRLSGGGVGKDTAGSPTNNHSSNLDEDDNDEKAEVTDDEEEDEGTMMGLAPSKSLALIENEELF